MDVRCRRLTHRAAAIIRDHGKESQELFEFAADHPITWKLMLARLRKDNQIASDPAPQEVAPLLGPGDREDA